MGALQIQGIIYGVLTLLFILFIGTVIFYFLEKTNVLPRKKTPFEEADKVLVNNILLVRNSIDHLYENCPRIADYETNQSCPEERVKNYLERKTELYNLLTNLINRRTELAEHFAKTGKIQDVYDTE